MSSKKKIKKIKVVPTKVQNIKFQCPTCGKSRLECILDGSHTCPVLVIDKDGDFEYGPYESNADVDRWQCLNCGYVISDNEEDILDTEDIAQWCLDNCSQE
jgi:ribosomal protein S27AE